MDDDDLFSVFADKGADAAKRKQPEGAASGVASVATAGGVAVALESDSKAAAGRATDEATGWDLPRPPRTGVAGGGAGGGAEPGEEEEPVGARALSSREPFSVRSRRR